VLQTVHLGLIQAKAGVDSERNLSRTMVQVRDAARRGAQIVCLEELFLSTYFPQVEDPDLFKLAEPVPGPTTEKLSQLAATEKIVIVASIFERRSAGIYHNTAVVIDADGSIAGKYRKMHIPDDPGYYEKFYFTPGDLGFPSFQTRYARIGVLVCWDQWFPEAARLISLSGAQIIVYPTAIGKIAADSATAAKSQRQAWRLIQQGHAVANGVFVAAVNRVGREGNLRFWGGSFVVDPFGGMITEASEAREEIVLAKCDLGKIDETRQNWPFLRDRRIDAYESLTARYLDPKPPQ
jgi:N-carbamoylputrescine amidase